MKLKFTISNKNIGILRALLTNINNGVWKSGQKILFWFTNDSIHIFPKELGVEETVDAQIWLIPIGTEFKEHDSFCENYTIDSLKDRNDVCFSFHNFSDFMNNLKAMHSVGKSINFKIEQEGKGAESKKLLVMKCDQDEAVVLKVPKMGIDMIGDEDCWRDVKEDLSLSFKLNGTLLVHFIMNYESVLLNKEASDLRINFWRQGNPNIKQGNEEKKDTDPCYKFEMTSIYDDFEMNLTDLEVEYEDDQDLPENIEIGINLKLDKFIALFKMLKCKTEKIIVGIEHEKKICVTYSHQETNSVNIFVTCRHSSIN
jgi:hypothetical protein